MDHLAEHIFKEFYQKHIMKKTGMKITSSDMALYRCPTMQIWSAGTDRIRPSARAHNVQLYNKQIWLVRHQHRRVHSTRQHCLPSFKSCP